MHLQSDTTPGTLDRATLTPLAQCALDDDTAQIDSWTCDPVHTGHGGAHLYRVSGTARSIPWSIFLKIARPVENWGDTESWSREVRAYQSGFLDDLPGNIAAPRCFAVVEHSKDEFWIWLQDVQDCLGGKWPPQRYGLAARHLGQFNGAYLAGRPLPDYDWLSRGWLRNFVTPYGALIEHLQQPPLPPLLSRACPSGLIPALIRFWSERERFLHALEQLPRTVCHLDAFHGNLFARDDPQGTAKTVLIDWAFAGIGAIGEELAPLIAMSRVENMFSANPAPDVAEVVFQGYYEGLNDAGWHGDPRLVQLGFTIAASLRYGLMWPNIALDWTRFDEQERAQMEQSFSMSLDKLAEFVASTIPRTLQMIEQARTLIDTIL
jgi:hypothetical protein